MITSEYLLGFRAALRYLITTAEAPGDGLRNAKVITRKTAEWLKVVNEVSYAIAEGWDIELWQTKENKLFGKRIKL